MNRRSILVMCTAACLAPAAGATPRDGSPRHEDPRHGDQRARTLEAITIEGAIDAPEVQFITSRDRLRFADDTGRMYRPLAAAVLDSLREPVRLRVVAPPGCPPFESVTSR